MSVTQFIGYSHQILFLAYALMKLSAIKITTFSWQKPIVLISITLAAFLTLYSESIFSLINFWWNTSTYSYGILIPPIVIYLIWLKRDRLAETKATPQPFAALLLIILSVIWLGAKLIDIQTIERVSLIALFPTLTWALLGNNATKIILFPLAYLFIAAPIWDPIAIPLQDLTALVSFKVLRITGIPILLEEHYISIPAGKFLIEKACAGLRFFVTAAAISSLYAYLNYRSLLRQFIFVTISLLGSIILNWVRVCIIIWVGQLTNMEHPLIQDHYSLGWWLFAGAIIPLFYFGSKISEPKMTSAAPKIPQATKKNISFTFTVLCLLILSTGPLSLHFVRHNGQQSKIHYISPPAIPPPWATISSSNNWKPVFKGADTQINSVLRADNDRVYLHISYYSKQAQGAELISETNALYNSNHWKKIDESVHELNTINGVTLQVKEIRLERNDRQRLIWFWYRVSDKNTIYPMSAKLLELLKLTGSSPGSAVVALATDYKGSLATARELLEGFSLVAYPAIDASLQYHKPESATR